MTKAAKVAKARKTALAYMAPALGVDDRVEDLLGRMTLDEKVYQLGSFAPWISKRSWEQIFLDKAGKFSPAKARRYIPKRGIGQLTCGLHNVMPRKGATIANGLQRVVAAHTRLGIPLLIHDEALHGLTAQGSTSFPQSIGLAATWNTKLVRRIAAAIGRETRSRGIHQVLAPTINIARDVRCGRTEETYGEDTHLASRMAVAFVKGVQGEGVAATLKHYVANFVGDGGRDSGEIHLSERYLREACFPAFEAAVREGGAMSVMTSYNAVDGVPCTSNRWLLVDVLRNEWGFRGYTVSDYVSVEQICTGHRTVESLGEAGKAAVEAGLDVELPHIIAYEKMLDLAKRGEVSAEAIDTSVRNVLRVKFMLGLFENPGADPAAAARVANCPAHRKLALDAAREAIVLLKNEKDALPLGKHVRSIAVIGPNADAERLGGYSTQVTKVTTVLRGLRARAGRGVKVSFAEGCTPDGDSRDGFARATALAARCDVAVLVMGNCLETEGENRDRSNLDLPGVQEDLIREVPQPQDSLSWMNAQGAPPGEAYLYSTPNGDLYHYDIAADELKLLAPGLGQCEQVVDGRYVHGINDQDYFLYDLGDSQELDRKTIAEAADGMRIQTLTGALDGNVYGSTYINQHMFRLDTETEELTDLGKVIRLGGQVDSIHAGGDGKVYMGSYVHATLSIYDPSKPWAPSRELDGNPRELGMVGHGQYRTQATVLGPDGDIWVGSIPSYNSAPTGALSRWNPETGEHKSWLDLVPGGGIYRIAADDRYLYCSGGGRFLVWDPQTESKLYEEERAAYALVVTPGGQVLGNSGEEMFVFDPAEMRVSGSFPAPIGRMDSVTLAPNGLTYGINNTGIAEIDAATGTGRKVSDAGGHLIATDTAGGVYFARGAALYRLDP